MDSAMWTRHGWSLAWSVSDRRFIGMLRDPDGAVRSVFQSSADLGVVAAEDGADGSLRLKGEMWPSSTDGPVPVDVSILVSDLYADRGPASVGVQLRAPFNLEFEGWSGFQVVATAPSGDLLTPDNQGLLYRAGDADIPQHIDFHGHRMTLPIAASIGSDHSFLVVTTPQGANNRVMVEWSREASNPSLCLVDLPELGRWGNVREWRIISGHRGGLAGAAESVRHHLAECGHIGAPLSKKFDELGLSHGAREGVGGSYLWAHFGSLNDELVNDLVGSGIRHLSVMGRSSSDHRKRLARVGIGGGPYFQTFDVYPPNSMEELGWRGTYPPEGSSYGWHEQLIRDRNGWLEPAWVGLASDSAEPHWSHEKYRDESGRVRHRTSATHNQTMVQSYRRCPLFFEEVVERFGIPLLESQGADGLLIDIVTALWGLECFDPRHPCSRTDDQSARSRVLSRLAARGLSVSSETGKWWALRFVTAFEGLLSYGVEDDINCIQLGDYPYDRERLGREFSATHRVPFFSMVAGDQVAGTAWWGRGNDRHPETWDAKDCIAALSGGSPIMVVDQSHPLLPNTPRWERWIASARGFDTLRDLTLDSRISRYDVNGDVARSEFSNGTVVEANLGSGASDGLNSGSWRIIRDDRETVWSSTP